MRKGDGRGPEATLPPLPPLFPSPRLAQWVRAFGVSRLARTILTARSAVMSWLHPTRPVIVHPITARKLKWLSRRSPCGAGPPLAWEDFYMGAPDASRKLRPHKERWQTDAEFFVGLVKRGICDVEQAEEDLGVSPEDRRKLEAFVRFDAGSPLARTIRRELLLRDRALAEFRRLCPPAALPRAA
jgi:hypothetical protein